MRPSGTTGVRAVRRHHRRVDADRPDLGAPARVTDRRRPPGQELREEAPGVFDVRGDLAGRLDIRVDGGLRAGRLAGAAVDALPRVDVELAGAFVDAVNGTFVDTRPVQYIYACVSDEEGHETRPRSGCA